MAQVRDDADGAVAEDLELGAVPGRVGLLGLEGGAALGPQFLGNAGASGISRPYRSGQDEIVALRPMVAAPT